MSILGYSSSYFLPEYWAGTPLYGEKIIPLLDYILSTDFVDSDKLAGAFYNIVNKYKNTADLPIEQIKAIIEESGYYYVLNLLGEDEESIRLLTYLLVLIHQFKGSKKGLQLVLNLLKREGKSLEMKAIGDIVISASKEASGFSEDSYVAYFGFTTDNDPFEVTFQIRTRDLTEEQCIASSGSYGFYIGVLSNGRVVLSLGNNRSSWNITERTLSVSTLAPETNYYVKLAFDGVSYEVSVSTDGKKYSNYINIASNAPLRIHKGVIYVGVDGSEGGITRPFSGYINLGPFAVDIDNIAIEEWFEGEEVGEENTFSVKADLDMGVLSSDFFKNFADFAKKYVYPSLNAFEARMNLDCELAFLPYVRQRISYTALVDLLTFVQFMTKEMVDPEHGDYTPVDAWEDFYTVNEDDGQEYDAFQVLEQK